MEKQLAGLFGDKKGVFLLRYEDVFDHKVAPLSARILEVFRSELRLDMQMASPVW